MAKGKGSPKSNSRNPKDWNSFEFVAINLSEADKAHFKETNSGEANELFDQLVTMVEGGYKLSVSYDGANACFIASLTCKDERDENYGYVLSSRSDDLLEAIYLNVFKTLYMCKDMVWPKETQRSSWG